MPAEDALGTAWHDRFIRETMIKTKTLTLRGQRDTLAPSAEMFFSCMWKCCYPCKRMTAAAHSCRSGKKEKQIRR